MRTAGSAVRHLIHLLLPTAALQQAITTYVSSLMPAALCPLQPSEGGQ